MRALKQRQAFPEGNDLDNSTSSYGGDLTEISAASEQTATSVWERLSLKKKAESEDENVVDTSAIKAFYLELRQSRHGGQAERAPSFAFKSTANLTADELSLEEEKIDSNRNDPHFTGEFVVRDKRGVLQVLPSEEMYFGETARRTLVKGAEFEAVETQDFAMELYESRIVSLQRFVAMTVMFHQMAKRVQDFFPKISFGLLGYRIDRSHSIVRIATTASPVSGDAVNERMKELWEEKTMRKVAEHLYNKWKRRHEEKVAELLKREKQGTTIMDYLPGRSKKD